MQANRSHYRVEVKSGNVWFLYAIADNLKQARYMLKQLSNQKLNVTLYNKDKRIVKVTHTIAEVQRLKRDIALSHIEMP